MGNGDLIYMKGRITKLFTVFLIIAFSFSISSASTTTQIKKPTIVFISPDFAESQFFNTVNTIMQSAADDLYPKFTQDKNISVL